MKKLLFSFVLFQTVEAVCIEGSSHFEKLLIEKSPALYSLDSEIRASESLLKANFANFYPSLNAVSGWVDQNVIDPYNREKGSVGYLEGRLNLFNGFRDKRNIQQKEIDLEIAKLNYEQLRRDLQIKLTQAMSEMIFLHKLQDILNQEAKITKEQKQMAAKKVASGLTSSVDNLEFDLREEEIRIQQRQIDQQHLEVHQKMNQLFGSDIADKDLEDLRFSSLDNLMKKKDLDLEQSLTVKKSQLFSAKAQVERQTIASEFLPTVDFTYGYGKITPSETTSLFDETSYRVLLTIPLFSGLSTVRKEKSAFSETKNKEFSLQQNLLDISSLYNSLSGKLKELTDLYTINERKLIISEKYFNLTVNEYKRGVKNSPDLVGATERWFSAQKRKPEILKEMEMVKVNLENITGI
ncbi:MAG: TolC family protein [Bdellovibrio sp.]